MTKSISCKVPRHVRVYYGVGQDAELNEMRRLGALWSSDLFSSHLVHAALPSFFHFRPRAPLRTLDDTFS